MLTWNVPAALSQDPLQPEGSLSVLDLDVPRRRRTRFCELNREQPGVILAKSAPYSSALNLTLPNGSARSSGCLC